MVLKEIVEKEKLNCYKIYLYIDVENNLCYSYEFSAYLLTRLLNIKMEESKQKLGTALFFTQLSIQSVVEWFSGPNTMVSDDLITVVLDDPNRCLQWKLEFDDLKAKQRKVCNKLVKCIHGLFRSMK